MPEAKLRTQKPKDATEENSHLEAATLETPKRTQN
jgi:hypothetical protein